MKITYDNNSKSKAVYNGELILNGEYATTIYKVKEKVTTTKCL